MGDIWMDGWRDGCMYVRHMDGWMERWMYGCKMYGWMDG